MSRAAASRIWSRVAVFFWLFVAVSVAIVLDPDAPTSLLMYQPVGTNNDTQRHVCQTGRGAGGFGRPAPEMCPLYGSPPINEPLMKLASRLRLPMSVGEGHRGPDTLRRADLDQPRARRPL